MQKNLEKLESKPKNNVGAFYYYYKERLQKYKEEHGVEHMPRRDQKQVKKQWDKLSKSKKKNTQMNQIKIKNCEMLK